jgi:hypothetical protein
MNFLFSSPSIFLMTESKVNPFGIHSGYLKVSEVGERQESAWQ